MHHKTIIEAIGNTPLVKLPLNTPATILAKLEYLNPGGSVKDRSALYMIEKAEQKKLLQPGGTIIDASSGNQGIALAMIGVLKGYKVIITVSEKISREKYQTLKAYGAQVVVCPATTFINDPKSYHMQAKALHEQIPGSFMPDQYYNIENRWAHYNLLGPEIWEQTNGTITHYFAGLGTGGTASGAGQYLKEKNPDIKVIGMDSENSLRATNGNPKPYAIEGIGIDFTSKVINYDVIDEIINIGDAEALTMLKTLAHTYGLLGGPSTGAVAVGVHKKLASLTKDDVVVMICGDSGRAYLSKNFYQNEDEPSIPILSTEMTFKENMLI
ncbi:MAG: cystathionine beta-synthase [Alteromonas naphthalenivorans]|jgi:cystathionine beta-synthase